MTKASARIMVTGAKGFVGRHLVAHLATRFPAARLFTDPVDVTDRAALDTAIRDFRPDFCFHLAAVSAVPDAQHDPDRAFSVNLGGTLTLARALLDHAPECRLIHAGSADCYGASFRSGTPLDETAALSPLNTYAASKAAADLALGAMAAESGLRVLRFRPFNHTGPGQSGRFALASFAAQLRRIARGDAASVLRVGNLDARRDILHVEDVVEAYARGLERFDRLPPATVLNLCSGTTRRIGDVLDAMVAASGLDVRIETDPARLRAADIPEAAGDASRAARLLDWHPAHDLDDIIRALLAPPSER